MKILFLCFILLFSSSLAAIVKSYIDEEGRPIDHHVGTYLVRDVNQGLYRVTYDVEMLGADYIANLDTNANVMRVDCDVSNIELIVSFRDSAQANAFAASMNVPKTNKFVTSSRWNCNNTDEGSMMLMRRVASAKAVGAVVTLNTYQGFYEEAIKDGAVTLEEERIDNYHKDFCFGANTDNCDVARGPIPIYSNKHMDLSCKNCFVGAKATLVLELEIKRFRVKKLAAGLKNININAGLVLGFTAQGAWNTGFEKTYQLVGKAVIVQFWIGPIPISIWYEIPITVSAFASLDAKLNVEAGATANWNIGDSYVSWTEDRHWELVKPNPKFSWSPVFSVTGGFKAEAGLSITPSFVLHFMRIVEMFVRANPSINLEATGDIQKREACLDVRARAKGEAGAAVHINIPIVNIRYDKVFGPISIFDTGVKDVAHKCIHFMS